MPKEIQFSDDQICRNSMRLLTLENVDEEKQTNFHLPVWIQGVWKTLINSNTTIEINSSHLLKIENQQIRHRFQFVRLLKTKNEHSERIVRLRAQSIEQW